MRRAASRTAGRRAPARATRRPAPSRERADVIERRTERHDAVGRHVAGRRLEPDDTARRGGNADGAAGVRADRGEAHARGHGRRPIRRSIRPPTASGSCGWRTGPNAESSLVVPSANSCRLVRPMNTAPASRSRVTISGIGRRRAVVAARGTRAVVDHAGLVDEVLDRHRACRAAGRDRSPRCQLGIERAAPGPGRAVGVDTA